MTHLYNGNLYNGNLYVGECDVWVYLPNNIFTSEEAEIIWDDKIKKNTRYYDI